MINVRRRRILSALLALFLLLTIWRAWELRAVDTGKLPVKPVTSRPQYEAEKDYFWRTIAHNYPVSTFRPLPTAAVDSLPRVQAKSFPAETSDEKRVRLRRQQDIKEAFVKSWNSYKKNAWLRDELRPVTGGAKDTFGGWGATLIDALDTLWIMDLKDEFDEAVYEVAKNAVFLFTKDREINVFETGIRFLGGLLSAYDLSGDERLLTKAHNVGDLMYKAFDTPNHLPVTRWNLHEAARGAKQTPSSTTLLAELGSFTMELTRLSLLTKDPKYYDAVQHISELLAESQGGSKLKGLWPIAVDPVKEYFDAGTTYTLGAMADSTYEYMPKMMALLGQKTGIYRDMYLKSMTAAREYLFFRPMTPDQSDILFSGFVTIDPADASRKKQLRPAAGHLTCFAGGMLALGGKLTQTQEHVSDGAKLTNGCVWAYKSFPRGVMPESFYLTPCPPRQQSPSPKGDGDGDGDKNNNNNNSNDLHSDACPWNPSAWHQEVLNAHSTPNGDHKVAQSIIDKENLPPSFSTVGDARYILRPEAIESIFIMYRITGDRAWQEKAWEMWKAIDTMTVTDLAYSAVQNVNPPRGQMPVKTDSMESFWLAETLKYFYLIFGEPDVLSLDDWVFNTEAHPFRRLK
ncbi:hypothetical protein E4U43_006272 [Claviceps pusilla]|uniref:alpha-1,2-Mannosidase n=1 Tax=Claviceps pusilla TaxID=123648 RepID=A0A9P7SZR8_9HYPO|nr:hypothetical protein E4U43_006272 [Claviceps pusilla]